MKRTLYAILGSTLLTGALLAGAGPATASPAPSQPHPAPYPGAGTAQHPGAGAVRPAPPTAPTTTNPVSPAAACTPYVDGDHAHLSSGDVSAHGWWYQGSCPNEKTTVTIGLQEYYSDGVWRTKNTGSKSVYPGGGSANRAATRATCANTNVAAFRSYVIVSIGNGASAYTAAQNLTCWVLP